MVSSHAVNVINRQQVDVAYTKRPNAVRRDVWDALFAGVGARRIGSDSTRTQSFMAHHVAWAVNKEGGPMAGTGRGASVSHRCDGGECIRPEHVVFTRAHRDNMARQRCAGLVLVTRQGVIIEEKPCVHDSQPADPGHHDTCRHISVVELNSNAYAMSLVAGWVVYP